jgi:hypothetical protein
MAASASEVAASPVTNDVVPELDEGSDHVSNSILEVLSTYIK